MQFDPEKTSLHIADGYLMPAYDSELWLRSVVEWLPQKFMITWKPVKFLRWEVKRLDEKSFGFVAVVKELAGGPCSNLDDAFCTEQKADLQNLYLRKGKE